MSGSFHRPDSGRPAVTQQVRHCPREGMSRNTRPLKIPARGAPYAHMITCPSSLEVRHLDRRADSTTAPRYLQSQKIGPELGVKGRRVRDSAFVGRFGPPTFGRAVVRRPAVLRRPRDATDLAKKVRTEACEDWATRSDQSTRIFGSVPLTCHYGRHPRDTPGRSGPRNPQGTKHNTHEFKQFPSGQCGFDSRHPLHTRKMLQDNAIGRHLPLGYGARWHQKSAGVPSPCPWPSLLDSLAPAATGVSGSSSNRVSMRSITSAIARSRSAVRCW